MPEPEDVTATLEATLITEVARMYEEVATHPDGDYHFYTGRRAAEMYGYRPEDLDATPAGAVAAFADVGCPIERARFQPGERVVDLGSGAGLDALIAARPLPVGWKLIAVATPRGPGGTSCAPFSVTGSRRGTANW